MSFAVYTKDAAQVVADANASTSDKVIEVLTAPLSLSETELVTKKNRTISILTHVGLFGLLAEAYGHKRAREGNQSFVPLFRG